jgi:hypothetical protein
MNMSNKLKLAFLAAVLAVIGAISSPVLAAKWPGGWNAYGDGRNAYDMVTRDGLNAYARVPHPDLNSPQFNGGGSSGYNADEKIH